MESGKVATATDDDDEEELAFFVLCFFSSSHLTEADGLRGFSGAVCIFLTSFFMLTLCRCGYMFKGREDGSTLS